MLSKLLEANQDKIDWMLLSSNPNAIDILENNIYKADKWELSVNPNTVRIFETNPFLIQWNHFTINPNIFEPDIKQYNIDLANTTELSCLII